MRISPTLKTYGTHLYLLYEGMEDAFGLELSIVDKSLILSYVREQENLKTSDLKYAICNYLLSMGYMSKEMSEFIAKCKEYDQSASWR